MVRTMIPYLRVILLAMPMACVGSIGDGTGAPSGGGPEGSAPGSPARPGGASPASPGGSAAPGTSGGGAPTDDPGVGPQPLRRLDRREYNNTVRDLLGDTSSPADRFPSDRDSEFVFRHPGLVSTQDYSTIKEAAEAVAASAVARIGELAPCVGMPEEACARTFVTDFGLRAYRRPLVDREIESLMTLYSEVRAAPLSRDYAGAIGAMIEGILQSPSFLYHWEGGPAAAALEGSAIRLNHYENASKLSYFLWGTMPDGVLFDAAAKQQLGTQGELEAQARRMLADPRARETIIEFVQHWLGLDQVTDRPKDPEVYPQFDDGLKAAMVAEAAAFVSHLVFEGDARFDALLTATFSFANQALAPIYGLASAPAGEKLERVALEPGERAGLLTQAAFLTVTGGTDGSHPIKRGKKIYERLLCGELPPPPADVPPPKPASAGGTTRERFAEHGQEACAKGCHALLDPLGFAFENYDGIGRYRQMDNGAPVDASGTFELDGQNKTFANARELVQHLAASDTVRTCFARHWLRFALRRTESPADGPSLESLRAAFTGGGGNIRDLMVGVAGSRSVRYRAPSEGEILP